MKSLVLALLLIFLIGFSSTIAGAAGTGPCLDQDVWVYIKHTDPWEDTCTVVVYVPKHSLQGDFNNCPAEDTKVVGRGQKGMTGFAGFHVVILKKGVLNDSKNYTTRPPRKFKIPQNNWNTWHVNK